MENTLKATDDFNQPLQGYQYGETFEQMICFNYNEETEEFANWVEIFVNAEEFELYEPNLTKAQTIWVENYAQSIQVEIRGYIEDCRDMEQTERSLMYS